MTTTGNMTIKDAAERINRSEKTILNWEAQGLITPERDERGWRIFTEEDIQAMEKIKEQKRAQMLSGRPAEGDEDDVNE